MVQYSNYYVGMTATPLHPAMEISPSVNIPNPSTGMLDPLFRHEVILMDDEKAMFAADKGDSVLMTITDRLAAEGTSDADMVERVQAALPDSIDTLAAAQLAELKAKADEMFADRRNIRSGFMARQREKWGTPLDQLFMLLEASREAGEHYNDSFQAEAAAEQDFVFEALRRLHARACLVASEIFWLMEGGYASGAMARWRTLHEIEIVGRFLKEHGAAVAEKYLLHHVVDAYKTAEEFQKLGYDAVSSDDFARMQADLDQLCKRFGNSYKESWGWAADLFKPRAATFAALAAKVSYNDHSPFYKLACHSNHAGSRGIHFDLGNTLNPPDSAVMLAGASDAGLVDPGTCTAVTILHLTTNFILYRNERLSAFITVKALELLTDDILDSFAVAEAELAAKAEELRRSGQPQKS
jgi:Family of unknown function (DUF5677)